MKTISLIFLALCAVCVAVADEEVNALGWPAEYSLTPRIVNGTDAEKGQFPYQVSLRFRLNDAHFCGGSILTDRFILTAAHCNQGFTASPMLVYAILGAYRRTKGGIEYALDKITPHQEWDGAKIKNDISLLRTAKKITFNEYIQPIALPTQETPSDTEVVLSGWGHYVFPNQNVELPDILKFTKQHTITADKCREMLKGTNGVDKVYDGNVCTINDPQIGACQGDSGGPLVDQSKKELVGVVSWGIPCGRGFPDAFTRVSYFLDWINNTIKQQS